MTNHCAEFGLATTNFLSGPPIDNQLIFGPLPWQRDDRWGGAMVDFFDRSPVMDPCAEFRVSTTNFIIALPYKLFF